MALEDLTGTDKFIDALNVDNPLNTDRKSQGDDHLRGIKNVLKNTFPNLSAVVVATADQLNSIISAASAATASVLMLRDANARAKVADGVADDDIATVGQVNVVGDALDAHVGAGGNTQHPDATASVSGFMTAAQFTKLAGIATGAVDGSPDYDSGWVSVSTAANGSKVFTHSFGAIPRNWKLQISPNSSGNPAYEVVGIEGDQAVNPSGCKHSTTQTTFGFMAAYTDYYGRFGGTVEQAAGNTNYWRFMAWKG